LKRVCGSQKAVLYIVAKESRSSRAIIERISSGVRCAQKGSANRAAELYCRQKTESGVPLSVRPLLVASGKGLPINAVAFGI
jgi:hypothetical protein